MTELRQVHKLWKLAQGPMLDEERWGNFPQYEQTLVEHANSLPIVVLWVLSVLDFDSEGVELDIPLLMTCVQVHDMGEPLTGGDQHHDIKTEGKDVEEWRAFMRFVSSLPRDLREYIEAAFALQYCRKHEGVVRALPPDGRKLIMELQETHMVEAAIFDFCERIDYLFSAVKGYDEGVQNEKETMIEHTVTRQLHRLDELAREFPQLGRVWTPTLRSEFLELRAEHSLSA